MKMLINLRSNHNKQVLYDNRRSTTTEEQYTSHPADIQGLSLVYIELKRAPFCLKTAI